MSTNQHATCCKGAQRPGSQFTHPEQGRGPVAIGRSMQVPDGDVKVMVRGCRGCYLAGAAGCKDLEA